MEYGLEGKRSLHFWVCAFAPLKKRKIKFVKSSWFSRKLKLAIAGIGPRNKLKIHSVTRNCSDLSLISKFLQISQSQSIAIQRNDDCFSRLWYGKSVSNWHICFDPSNRSSLQFLNYFDYIDNHNSFVIHQRITFMRFEVQFNKNIQVGRKYFAWFWHISICAFNCVSRFFFIHEFETLLPYRRREKQLLFRIKHFRTFFFSHSRSEQFW